MAESIIKGSDLMLFYQGKSIAFATAHTLSISAETSDVSSKDHGVYGASEVTKITWEITSENLYTIGAFNQLFDLMIAKEAIEVKFCVKAETDPDKTVADGDYENWTPATLSSGYTGKVIITSLSANANNGENATFSATLTGTGKLKKFSASAL